MIFISLAVHEQLSVVKNQLSNIGRYLPGAKVVVHLNRAFRTPKIVEELEQVRNCIVNPVSVAVRWGGSSLLMAHVSNARFITEECEVGADDYVVLEASNDMYVRRGLEDYIARYLAGFQRSDISSDSSWHYSQFVMNDASLSSIVSKAQGKLVCSQHEGTFYRVDVLKRILSYLTDFDFSSSMDYPSEEVLLPSIATGILSEDEIGCPIVYSEVIAQVSWANSKESHFVATGARFPLFHKILIRYALGHCRLDSELVLNISKGEFAADRFSFLMQGNYNSLPLYEELFAVKRVPRRIDDPLRLFINGLN